MKLSAAGKHPAIAFLCPIQVCMCGDAGLVVLEGCAKHKLTLTIKDPKRRGASSLVASAIGLHVAHNQIRLLAGCNSGCLHFGSQHVRFTDVAILARFVCFRQREEDHSTQTLSMELDKQ